ncbi:MAG: peptidase [Coleofasciculaceae cyanobacterium]
MIGVVCVCLCFFVLVNLKNQRRLGRYPLWLAVGICTFLGLVFTQFRQVEAHKSWSVPVSPANSELVQVELSQPYLPPFQSHPLPPTLEKWQDTTTAGDYFSQVKPTPLGYLIWSQFPVKVYIEQPPESDHSSASFQRFQGWLNAVLEAAKEWSVYLPLELTKQQKEADISILRSRPPLEASINRQTGEVNLPRVRSAQTSYEFYLKPTVKTSVNPFLYHRFTIKLSPDQTAEYTLATARHELGHALGIWGHSLLETDTMYFSQVPDPPQISLRDINTLKRIYQQPTRLGWSLDEN